MIIPIPWLRVGGFFIAAVTAFTSDAASAEEKPSRAHFHHVHLNVTDRAATMAFYTRIFGAVPITYAHKTEALFTERSFILMNEVGAPPPSALESGIWHIGWGGVDMPNEYKWLQTQGVKIHTPLYALRNIHVTYVQGPDDELIEINTMGHHRFGHVHLFAEDVNVTTRWYGKHLGLEARRELVPKPDLTKVRAWSNGFRCDNVSFVVYGRPDYTPAPPWWRFEPLESFAPSKGRAIDHIAFSYREIETVFERMQSQGVTIVEPIAFREAFNHTSFFVQAPDKVLVEIVEAKPIPEGIWD